MVEIGYLPLDSLLTILPHSNVLNPTSAPSYEAPAPSYEAPAPSYEAPAPVSQGNVYYYYYPVAAHPVSPPASPSYKVINWIIVYEL